MEKYYVINSQEDEDGCILYPWNAIIEEKEKSNHEVDSRDNKVSKGAGIVEMISQKKILVHAEAKRMSKK